MSRVPVVSSTWYTSVVVVLLFLSSSNDRFYCTNAYCLVPTCTNHNLGTHSSFVHRKQQQQQYNQIKYHHQQKQQQSIISYDVVVVTRLMMSESGDSNNMIPQLRTFREAEVQGLKYMQERKFKEALQAFQKAFTLPGSKSDIVRTKSLSGPSPVGGSMGGFESKNTLTLDEFELQAAYYNMACAYSQLNQNTDAVQSLKSAFDNGFDNYSTVRSDPDLDPIKNTMEFQQMMEKVEPPKKGFNPFGLFGK